MLNPNWQIHIKFTTDLKNMAMIRENKSCFRHEKNLLDFQELLDGVQKTSRGQNPHRLTTSKVPRMQVLHQRRIDRLDTNRWPKNHHLSALMVLATFCYILSHRFTQYKKVMLQFTVFHPLQKKKLSFCNQKKKTSAPKMVHHQCFSFSPYPPLKQHESEKVLKSKPKGLCGKITCRALVWLQSEDHPTNQVSL